MSPLTSSIASRWSGVSVNGKRSSNSRCQSPSGPKAWPLRAAALGVQLEQLPGQLLGGPAGARLERVPAVPAELAQRRMGAAGADVAGDLGELVGGDEDAVVALVFEVQVVARDARHGARLEAGEAGDAVVLVDDDVARAQLGERAQGAAPGAAAGGGALGAAAAQQPLLGIHRQLQRGRDEALAQRGRPRSSARPSGAAAAAEPLDAGGSSSQPAFRRARL